jgi:hypothetical protein
MCNRQGSSSAKGGRAANHGLTDGVIFPRVSGVQQDGYCSRDSAHSRTVDLPSGDFSAVLGWNAA